MGSYVCYFGKFPPRKPMTTMKFPPEARGSFGLAMREKENKGGA